MSRHCGCQRDEAGEPGAGLLGDLLGLVPHLWSLIEAVGLFGLEPRLRQLAALAVARSSGCSAVVARHQLIGRAAGLTDAELSGELEGLTAAELSAIALALGTVSRPLPVECSELADSADLHFTSEEIRQLQAVALAVDIDCKLARGVSAALRRFSGARAR